MSWKQPLVSIATAIALAHAASARDIRVPAERPTISAALASAADGDRILVDEGVYRENLDLSGKRVSLVSSGCPQRTVLDGGGLASAIRVGRGEVRIEGFTVTGGRAPFGGGIIVETSGPAAPAVVELARLIVRGNEALEGGGGLAARGAPGSLILLTVENVLVAGNAAREGGGALLEADLAGGAVDALVVNCTFAENRATSLGGGLLARGAVFPRASPEAPIAFNCVFWTNRGSGDLLSDVFLDTGLPPRGKIQFSDLSDGQFAGEFGNVTLDPAFRDPARGDYRLRPGSPIGDAGVPRAVGPGFEIEAPLFDFDGAVRYDDPEVPNLNGGFHPMGFDGDSPAFVRGNANADPEHSVDISDAIYTFDYLFLSTSPRPCVAAMDANDDGEVDISDGLYTLSYLFLGGSSIPPPFPSMGLDPTLGPVRLACDDYPTCWIGYDVGP